MKKLSLIFLFFLALNVSGQELKQKSSITEFVTALEKSDAEDVFVSDKYIEFYFDGEFKYLSIKNRIEWKVEKLDNVFYLTGVAKNRKNKIVETVNVVIDLYKQTLILI